MKTTSYEYTTRWAVIQLAIFQSGFALISDEYILLLSLPAFPDYWE